MKKSLFVVVSLSIAACWAGPVRANQKKQKKPTGLMMSPDDPKAGGPRNITIKKKELTIGGINVTVNQKQDHYGFVSKWVYVEGTKDLSPQKKDSVHSEILEYVKKSREFEGPVNLE